MERFVCKASEVEENDVKQFELADGEGKVLLVKEDGKVYALGTKCSHYGAPLSKGVLYKGRLRCPWHGACYNVATGDIEDFPGNGSIPSYEVITKEDAIWIKGKKADLLKNLRSKEQCGKDEADSRTFVVIGGGAAGFQCAETLREEGFKGRLVMITAEDVSPYDRTKLSKAPGESAEKLALREPKHYEQIDLEIVKGKVVTRLEPKNRSIMCSDGTSFTYDKVFCGTGVYPRRFYLPGADLKNIFYVRTHHDANNIANLAKDKNVVLVGTSFISMEIAAYLAGKAASVSVIGRSNVPFKQVFGQEMGARIKELYESKGVVFHLKTHVKKFLGKDGQLEEVVIPGQVLKAELCVIGIGTEANVSYLDTAGMNYSFYNNVVVNDRMETAVTDIYAGGDLVAFPLSTYDNKLVNIGHWQVAQIHGRIAGRSMMGIEDKLHTVPYFFASFFGKNLRVAGFTDRFDDILVTGDVAEFKVVAYYFKDDKVVSVVTVGNDPVASMFAALLSDGRSLRKAEIKKDPNAWINGLHDNK